MLITEQGKAAAINALEERRANKPKQIDDGDLPVGSPMHFYCIACGHSAGTLPESYTSDPPKLCDECKAMKDLGWLE